MKILHTRISFGQGALAISPVKLTWLVLFPSFAIRRSHAYDGATSLTRAAPHPVLAALLRSLEGGYSGLASSQGRSACKAAPSFTGVLPMPAEGGEAGAQRRPI